MNHPAFNLIKSFYCLDTTNSGNRWDECIIQFQKVGISWVERIIGEVGENPYLSFNKAHYDAIAKGAGTGEPFCIFENDIEFDEMTWKRLEEATAQLPADWDLFYLGCNIIGADTMVWQMPMKVSANIARLFNAWQTHAIVYSPKMAEKILTMFDPSQFPVYDEWLRMNVMPSYNVYLCNPMIVYQRPTVSVLTGQRCDYTGCHKQGNEYLNKLR